jgi:hypothetical protein
MARKRETLGAKAPLVEQADEDSLLEDHVVAELVSLLTAPQRLFLAGLGRGLSPVAAARRAGWPELRAGRIVGAAVSANPAVRRLAAHLLRLRDLASMDGDAPLPGAPPSVH